MTLIAPSCIWRHHLICSAEALSEWVNVFSIPLYFLSFFIVFYVKLQLNLRRHFYNEKVRDLKASHDINYGDQIKKN